MKFYVRNVSAWESTIVKSDLTCRTGNNLFLWMVSHQSFKKITCGVPQGSLLGPLLYLCYSNDMACSVRNKLLLYADDSVILVSDKYPSVVSHELSKDLESRNHWLIDNQLSLHVGKTECTLFGSHEKLKRASDIKIT